MCFSLEFSSIVVVVLVVEVVVIVTGIIWDLRLRGLVTLKAFMNRIPPETV